MLAQRPVRDKAERSLPLCPRIGAIEGQLKIVAKFPKGNVSVTNFSPVGEAPDPL